MCLGRYNPLTTTEASVTALSNHLNVILDGLDLRRSVPSKQLGAPGPDDTTLLRMLRSAVRVPDHGKRTPFRFLSIKGDARHALGALLAERSRERDRNASDAVVEKDRQRFNAAPLILTVIAKIGPDAKIPVQERLLSAGCVCFALLQAAQGLGFGAQWLTGWAAYDPVIGGHLGVGAEETIVGFIHIGSASSDAPERERPDPATLLSDWSPTQSPAGAGA
jgi:nitroreductase